MKIALKLALLCLTIATPFRATIMPRELVETPEQLMIKALKVYFTDKLKALKPKVTDKGANGPVDFAIAERNATINVVGSGSLVNVALKSDYETHNLEFENVDFEDEKAMVESKYVGPFIEHLNQIKTKTIDIFEAVQKGLLAATFTGGEDETRFDNVIVEGKPTDALIVFQIGYVNSGIRDGADPIYGELLKDGKHFKLTIITKFFQKSFQISVFTDHYLVKEAQRLANQVLSHLYSMYLLNEGPERDEAFKYFDAGEFMDDKLEGIWQSELNEQFTVAASSDGSTISFSGGEIASCSYDEPNIDDRIYFMRVICELGALGGQVRNLVLPGESIYTVGAVADRFFREIARTVKHAVGGFNEDEYVSAFPENR